MTKIKIFSGFLGAGKTTLIKKLIAEAYTGEKLVLIENEFGQIGIDGGFLQDAGVEITEMNSGCICLLCCRRFRRVPAAGAGDSIHPTTFTIEPTSVGKLSDVIRAVQNLPRTGGGAGWLHDCGRCQGADVYQKNSASSDNQIAPPVT